MKKTMQPRKVKIGENEYTIFPFGAFYAASLQGDLLKFLSPFVGGIVPLAQALVDPESGDKEVGDYMPALMDAVSAMDGKAVEDLLRKLLLVGNNINVVMKDDDGKLTALPLTEDVIDDLFVQDVQNMYILAIEVIKTNYSGFFNKLLSQYGLQGAAEKILTSSNMATLTQTSSGA